MSDLDQLKGVIRQSTELSKLGHDEEALALVDDSLARAIRENRAMWIRVLSHQAAVISDSMGDQQRVRRYYEQSLTSSPDSPMALYGFAKVLHRLGETAQAKEHAAKCYRLIQGSDSELDSALLELVLSSWPELRQPQN